MASGIADYTKIIRPGYGGAKRVLGVVHVEADDTTTLVEVTGKGMIYGGTVYLTAASTQKSGRPKLNIDGALLSEVDFNTLNIYNMIQPHAMPLSLIHYDEDNYRYAVGINYGITFEESVLVEYEEKEGARPYVVGQLFYALL